MTVSRLRFVAVGAALLVCAPLMAQESQPSDGFLEYLASLVDQDGEWIDPLALEELPEDDIDFQLIPDNSNDNTQHAEEIQ